MKIISFSNLPAQPFWSMSVQALTPWISRIRHSPGQAAGSTAALAKSTPSPLLCRQTGRQRASNDPMFELAEQPHSMPISSDSLPLFRNSLRVVRESDSAIKPDCAGRMVISGRMADVCAEVERMALRAGAATVAES